MENIRLFFLKIALHTLTKCCNNICYLVCKKFIRNYDCCCQDSNLIISQMGIFLILKCSKLQPFNDTPVGLDLMFYSHAQQMYFRILICTLEVYKVRRGGCHFFLKYKAHSFFLGKYALS